MTVVLIPAFEPDQQLIKLIDGLAEKNFSALVVNDGSGREFDKIFDIVSQKATVIKLEKNKGKGGALKAGMRYIVENIPDCTHFITCDADGQHRVEDVVRVDAQLKKGEKFVLTVRERKTKIPLRSKIGNNLSRFVYALLANRYLSDNQSGLRGFSTDYINWMVNVEKNKYDYEMNVLYYAAKMGLKISTLPIEAIYIGKNESSHFNPILDTVRIYKSLFALAGGTFIALLASEIMVLIISLTLGYQHIMITLPGVAAVSYLINVLLNKYIFFKNITRYDYWSTLVFKVISYFVYTLMCLLLYFTTQMPLFWAFNLAYFVCIPLRYVLHKFIFIASLTKE